MRYLVYLVDAFTGHILHPDGSGRTQRVGENGFEEEFATREDAMRRKDELLGRRGVTEILVTAENWSEPSVFRNHAEIARIAAERKAAFERRSR